jgi:hypothetical protein
MKRGNAIRSKPDNKPNSYPIKIYFPTISRDIIQKNVFDNNGRKSNASLLSPLSKYLVNENMKTILYGSTGIFDITDSDLYQLSPIDRPVKELTIETTPKDDVKINSILNILVDSSYMKRYTTPSFQIPYEHHIEKLKINTYKLTPSSNTRFVIELKDNRIHDFYIQTVVSELNIVEINTFLKKDIISFLSLLKLYTKINKDIMWSWIIKVTIFSLLLIFLIHYLYTFFKTTLTAPKLKDLVNKPQAKYNTIYKSLQNTADGRSANLGDRDDGDGGGNNKTVSKNLDMKSELMKYVKELSTGSGGSASTSVSELQNRSPNDATVLPNMNYDGLSNGNIIMPQNEITSIYSATNILSDTGANGISTRVNNNTKYMRDINNVSSHPTSSVSALDYGTPSMSSSYSSAYSPY